MSISDMRPKPSPSIEQLKLPSRHFVIVFIALFIISIIVVCILLTRLHYIARADMTRMNLANLAVTQGQFNEHLLLDLDNLSRVLTSDVQETNLDTDMMERRVNVFTNDNQMLQAIGVLNADGEPVFNVAFTEQTIDINHVEHAYYAIHQTQQRDTLYIDVPIQNPSDNEWLIPMSRAIYTPDGALSHVVVLWVSSSFWSQVQAGSGQLNDYERLLVREDGTVLTQLPYDELALGTILNGQSVSDIRDDSPPFMAIQQLADSPVYLVVNIIDPELVYSIDNVAIIITLVAIGTIISGLAVLSFYLAQHRALQMQTDTLVGMNVTLQQEIATRSDVEQALSDNEKRYRLVTELISDFAFSTIVHPDGTLQDEWITDSFITMTGFARDEFGEATSPINRGHPDDVERYKQDLDLTLSGQETVTEYRYLTKSNEYIWLRVKRRPIIDEHGRVARFVAGGQNITAEKEAELALIEREDRYRRISNILSDFAYETSITEDGTLNVEWTVGSLNTLGISSNNIERFGIVGGDVHPDDKLTLQADFQRTLQNQQTVTEYRIFQDGDYRWIRSIRVPFWDDEEQRVVRILGGVKDITAEKNAQFALQQNQQLYQEVTELMSDYALSIRVENQEAVSVEWVVGSVEALTGVVPDDVINDLDSIVNLMHPDDEHILFQDMARTMAGEKTTSEYRIFHAITKEIRWFRVTRKPIWNTDHTDVIRILAGVMDITAQKEAEIALRDGEERYRLVSQMITDYVFSTRLHDDQSVEVEWIAGSYEAVTGIPIDEVYRQSKIPQQAHPDDYVTMVEDIRRTRTGETTVSEYRVIHALDNSVRWIRVVRQPVWDEDHQKVIRIIGAASDITVEKTTQSALRESEERYRILTDLMSDYVYSLTVLSDQELQMDWFAGSFETITGTVIEDFPVASPRDMVKGAHPDDYDIAWNKIQQTLKGQSTVGEYRITNAADQKPRWIRATRHPVMDDTGTKVVRILGAVTDITAQKLAEFALRDSEERYRLLTELMTDYAFSIRIEDDGRLYREWLLGDFEKIMGYSISYSGYVTRNEDGQPNDNIEMIAPDVDRVLRGEPSVTEYQIINRQDHKPRWIRATRQPIWNPEHSKVVRYLGAVKDITLEKEAEMINREADQLRQDLEREKGLHELRSRFVSMVTHEFRNPLAAIQSSVSILHQYNYRLSEESRQEKYDRIYGQIKRLTNLLEDLLQVGELEDYAQHFSPQRLDIIDIINDLYAEYHESIGKNHQLVLETEFQKLHTYGDVQLLRQTFGNLISNAIKYSPAGSAVTCRVKLDNRRIVIDVVDNGIGIPGQDYEKLFKAFYRASNITTQPGTGLGLIIAKQSVELHHGTIAFASEIGEGTTFTVTIPQVIGKENDT